MLVTKFLLSVYFLVMSYMSLVLATDKEGKDTKIEKGLYITGSILGAVASLLILLA
jgi:hypothetical protein